MPVPANRELMVYYGPSYASDLGIDPDKQLTVYQIYKNPGKYYGPSYASDLGIDPDKQLTVYQIYKNPGEFSVPHFYYD